MSDPRTRYAAILLGVVAFLGPVKFGNPVVLDAIQPLPEGGLQWTYYSWPIALLLLGLGVALVPLLAGTGSGRLPWGQPALVLGLGLGWLGSQVLALPGSIYWQRSLETVLYFAACILVLAALLRHAHAPELTPAIGAGLAAASLVSVVLAFEQHFGGLEATRRLASTMATDAALLKRLASGRVFGPFVYPNALAGFLVIAFGPVLAWIWTRPWRAATRGAWLVAGAVLMGWCLVLTGSRGGLAAFGLMAVTGGLLLARTRRQRWAWIGLAVGVLVLGAILIRSRGGASLEARIDYWRGAVGVIRDHPWLGTGPGTFGSIYPFYRMAGTEEPELVHNAYLQMFSDSGVLGFVAFGGFWGVGLWLALYRARQSGGDPVQVALAAALVGWVAHQGFDFNLHIPGLALPAMMLLGLAVGRPSPGNESVPQAGLVRGRSWWWSRLAVVGLAVMVAFWEGRLLVAKSRLSGGDLAGAVRLAPRNADYWGFLSQAAEEAEDLALAVRAAEVAVELDRYRASRHWRLGLIESKVNGWTARSVGHVRAAARLDPANKQYQEALAEVEEKLRQPPGALLLSAPQGEVAGF